MTATTSWLRVLRDLHYDIKVDVQGDLIWTEEGVRFRCVVEPQDPTYLRLIIPLVWYDKNPDPADMVRASQIAHDVNSTVKVAKLILGANGVYATAEAFYPTHDVAAGHIVDMINMLRLAAQLFSDAFFVTEDEDAVERDEHPGKEC